MKILLIVNTDGALYVFRKPIISHLISRGHIVETISGKSTYFDKLRKLGVKTHELDFDRHSISPLKNLKVIWQLRLIIKKIRPDIVHNFTHKPSIYGSIAAKLIGVKKIHVTITGLGTLFVKNNLLSLILRELLIFQYHIALKTVDTVFFQNPDDLNLFVERKIVRKNQAVLTNGSGINLDEYPIASEVERLSCRNSLSKELNINFHRHQIVLFPARGVLEKGFFEYYEAARLLSNSQPNKFIFIHVGLIDSAVNNHISISDIKVFAKRCCVHYLGFREDIYKLMIASDIICLPSYREGVPRSLIEGLALGKPLVTTDVPGCREVVIDGWNGFLCEPKSPESLAIQIQKITPEFSLSAKSRSRELCESKFDVRKLIEITMARYGNLK